MEAWAGFPEEDSSEQALVGDQSDSITDAGHWAGKAWRLQQAGGSG